MPEKEIPIFVGKTFKEAHARIQINQLLEDSGWRFYDDENGKANIRLEAGVNLNETGEDFEHVSKGYLVCLSDRLRHEE